MWLHLYAKFVSAATVLLLIAGGLVTSTGSGLAVPDWPTSYGWNMFTFPMKHMVGGIFYEHGHRLIASGVGFLTIGLAFWLWKADALEPPVARYPLYATGDCAVIGGHCLGANIALHFAARHPERTAGLVLIEPMPPQALAGSMRRLMPFRNLLLATAKIVIILNRLGLHRSRIEAIDLEEWDRATQSGEADLARYAAPLSDLKLAPVAAYLQSLAAVGEPLPPLGGIRAPALVLASRNSTMIDPARARAILEALPHAEFVILDAEHWIPTEQPEAMRLAIEDWLARKAPGRAA